MKQLTLVIQNETGLHARPAKALVNLAKGFQSDISVTFGDKKVNAKSMIGILKLGVRKSDEIMVLIDGADEERAAKEIETAVSNGLGESASHDADPTRQPKAAPQPQATAPSAQKDQLVGVSASPGIAIGELFQLRRQAEVADRPFRGVSAERDALQQAVQTAADKIRQLQKDASRTLSAEEADIFDAHLEILHDIELQEAVEAKIQAEQAAPRAWQQSIDEMAESVAQSSNALLAARATDVRDVGRQVQAVLSGGEAVRYPERPFILVTDDLTPSETVALDRRYVLGFATAAGGPTAHSAILARALKLPAVVALGDKILEVPDGEMVILNGQDGTVLLSPGASAVALAKSKAAGLEKQRVEDEANAMQRAKTEDGHRIEVVANIGNPAEAAQAFSMGAEGVGLLRTEFLFLGQDAAPNEETQTAVYKKILEAMQGQPVIIRTLDIGGDKPVPYIEVPHEANPFLGERGIRLCLNRPELFKTQLRAIVRASASGNALIMFPMVSDVSELIEARKLVDEVTQSLDAQPIPVGMMIEVPAAALMADQFAPHLDFFSVGTNDLTQYTLAIDRQHPSLARLSDALHPAVLRLIDKTVRAADEASIWVGVCGELAADLKAVPILVGLGVKELSVNMNAVASVKAAVRRLTRPEAAELAQRALACATAADVRQLN